MDIFLFCFVYFADDVVYSSYSLHRISFLQNNYIGHVLKKLIFLCDLIEICSLFNVGCFIKISCRTRHVPSAVIGRTVGIYFLLKVPVC